MITPLQQDARRYLRSWVTIAAAWAIVTAVVLVWSIGARDTSPAADLSTAPRAPQPVTVTAQPTAPPPTLGGPAPTRWPPVPTGTPATFGNVGAAYGAMYRCVNGQPRPGITVDCSQAPMCDAADSLPWQVISEEGRLIEDACVSGRQFTSALSASCETARTATGYVDGRCALQLLPGDGRAADEGGYQMVVLTIACAQSGQGTDLPASCIGKP